MRGWQAGRRRWILLGGALALAVALLWPESGFRPDPAGGAPFAWDRDGVFRELERDFRAAVRATPEDALEQARRWEAEGRAALAGIAAAGGAAPLPELGRLEEAQFRLGALAAAHGELLPALAGFVREARLAVGEAARRWPAGNAGARHALHRVVVGGRAALEEALAQHPAGALPALSLFETASSGAPSATPAPSTTIHGVRVQSGDVVLSRGGAPTSALIARGNDFPGNFSHAALVHVAEDGTASVVESLIERGAVVSTLEEYLGDPKLRILLLRLRPDHPALAASPDLPHRAASALLARVRTAHVPYDFPMDWRDPGALFCSEVPYLAYRGAGVDLWPRPSTISAPGLSAWLAGMGVRHFATLVPSDLEVDPSLVPVAEWRNPEGLRQDRLDNAVLDALLEAAEEGARLGYPWWELPAARAAVGWSVLVAALGAHPPVPEGMSAGAALRVRALVDRVHPRVRDGLVARAEGFRQEQGFEPPYWELVAQAREAVRAEGPRLDPYLRWPERP